MSDTPRTDAAWLIHADSPRRLCSEQLERALARYEQTKLPEEPVRYIPGDEELLDQGFVWVHYGDYTELRTYAAAEHVRAEEAEKDARRFEWIMPIITGDTWCEHRTLALGAQLMKGLDGRSAIDAAIRAIQADGKETR